MLRLMVVKHSAVIAVTAVGLLATACTATAGPSAGGTGAPTGGSGFGDLGPAETVCYRGALTVTSGVRDAAAGKWTATVTAVGGSTLGSNDLLVREATASVDFGVAVRPGAAAARLTVTDEAGRVVAARDVTPPAAPSTPCSP